MILEDSPLIKFNNILGKIPIEKIVIIRKKQIIFSYNDIDELVELLYLNFRHIFLTVLNIYRVVIKIPVKGIVNSKNFPVSAIEDITKNSAIKPLVNGNPILAKAAKIKIFAINGELSERESNSLIDLVFLKL